VHDWQRWRGNGAAPWSIQAVETLTRHDEAPSAVRSAGWAREVLAPCGIPVYFYRNVTWASAAESQWVYKIDWIVGDIGVTIPGLRVGRVDDGEACGVGGHPAAEGRGVLAEEGVSQVGLGVVFVSGEFVGGDAGVDRVEFAIGEVVEVLDDALVEAGHEARGAEVVRVNKIGGAICILGDELAVQVDVVS